MPVLPMLAVKSLPMQRRQLLGYAAMLCAVPRMALADGTTSAASGLFLSAATDPDEQHWVVGFGVDGPADAAGEALDDAHKNAPRIVQRFRQRLPERAHDIAVNPQRGFFVVLARRPGTWLQLGSLPDGAIHASLQVPADRHLFGHGIFSSDGAWFYTTESDFNDLEGNSGRVVAWAVQGSGNTAALVRMQEFHSHGVGPHELLLHPDGNTLIVANGGIRTHPAHDRDNLNIDTMQPSLAYIDRHSGELHELLSLPAEFHQASIRHLDVNAGGLVALGMQFEGEPFREVPLVATHRRGEAIQLFYAPPGIQPQLKQYIGSVRFDSSGRFIAASSPKGNLLTFWNAEDGSLLHSARARDGCGICATDKGFIFSTGTGRVAHIDLATAQISDLGDGSEVEQLFFDNHLGVASI